MPVFRGSRYEGLDYTSLIVDGVEKKFMHLRTDTVELDAVGDQFTVKRKVSEEETMDQIAFVKYSKPRLGWVLAEVNGLENFWDLPIGSSIVMPSAEFMAKF